MGLGVSSVVIGFAFVSFSTMLVWFYCCCLIDFCVVVVVYWLVMNLDLVGLRYGIWLVLLWVVVFVCGVAVCYR